MQFNDKNMQISGGCPEGGWSQQELNHAVECWLRDPDVQFASVSLSFGSLHTCTICFLLLITFMFNPTVFTYRSIFLKLQLQ